MGYYANTYGNIVVKDKSNVDLIADILEESGNFEEVDVVGIEIEVIGYLKYHGEDYPPMYEQITPYISDGYIEFTGDDGEKWRHVFEAGQWIEYDAEIQWVNPHPVV